jgi:hypothetical protein
MPTHNSTPEPQGSAPPIKKQSTSDPLLTVPSVEGEVRVAESTSRLRWSITVESSGSITITFEPVEHTRETAWLLDVGMAQGRFLPRLNIRGTAADGVVVQSDSVHLLNVGTESDATGRRLRLSGDASKLRLVHRPAPETSRGLHVSYFTVGMRVFGSPSVDTAIGRVTLAGPTTVDDPNHVHGQVHIEATGADRSFAEWLSECDRLVDRVLDMVSFAEGGFIRWSARRVDSEEGIIVIDCEGAKGAGVAWDGVFHHLNLQPVLDLAVSRYTNELCEATGLNVALEWFVHHPRYAELQLISAVTALEHLVAAFEKRHIVPPIMDPRTFQKLLEDAQALWETARENSSVTDQPQIDRVKEKLLHLNEPSARDKLEAMLRTYSVPLLGLTLSRISKAVGARNSVIHSGLYRGKKGKADLQEHVAVLRELLKRIFLTLLAYQGQYFSLLNGPEWNQFPPAQSGAVSESPSSSG